MRRYKKDIFYLALIAGLIILFFARLFYPQSQIIVTPDFGTSDSVARSLATKFIYGQRLQAGLSPLWTSLLGGGYPLLADAIGVFYPLHIVLFTLFEPVTAYNVSLVVSLILFGFGIYGWSRYLHAKPLTAAYTALTLTFSGIMIPRLTHGMIISTLALLPWVLWATAAFTRRMSKLTWSILVATIALQLLSNFPQASAITIGFALIYYIFLTYRKEDAYRGIPAFFAAIFLSFGIAAIQMIPSWEYLRLSSYGNGFNATEATYYSFLPKNFLMFLHPFFLGNPKTGGYPPFWAFDGSIYWENSGYIGIVPLLFALVTLISLATNRLSKRTRTYAIFFLLCIAGSAVLMLGKHAPTYFVFSIPPFSLFRDPSRYIWIFVISLTFLGSISVDEILSRVKHRVIAYACAALMAINIASLIYVWYPYHLIQPATYWLSAPPVAKDIGSGKVFSLGISRIYNTEFISRGWTRAYPYYFFRNGLQADNTLFWHIPNADNDNGLPSTRGSALTSALTAALLTSGGEATVSSTPARILELLGIDTVVSSYTLRGPSVKPINTYTYQNATISAYRISNTLPRAHMVFDTTIASTFEEVFRILNRTDFDPRHTAIVESPVTLSMGTADPEITTEESKDEQSLTVHISNLQGAGLLVVEDSYYPGWQATLDGKQTKIVPVNISQRGVVVPKGNHTVRMRYIPQSLQIGLVVSGVSILLLIAVAFPTHAVLFRILHAKKRKRMHPQRSHDR